MPRFRQSLVWFRRDLRCFDHAALYHALKESEQVCCAFIFDKAILDPLPRNDRRVEFIRESVAELDTELRKLGGFLLVRHDDASEAIPRLAQELGVDAARLASPEGIAMLAGNAFPPNADPIAMAYAGHQFGNFVPQLGDGRALLVGEVVDRNGARRDIQLKGSGPTRFSRNGDGRAALGPVLREYVVSEAMAALGIPTRIFPRVAMPGEVVGAYHGLKVIAPAAHDTGSAVVAVPSTRDDFAYISSGTWSLMGLELDAPIINDDAYAANLTNEGGAYGTFRLLKNVMGLWLAQQCRAVAGRFAQVCGGRGWVSFQHGGREVHTKWPSKIQNRSR